MIFVQSRTVIVWVYAGLLAVVLTGMIFTDTTSSPDALPIFGILGVMGVLVATLSRLSVTLSDDTLSVWLGPGLFRQAIPLSDIAGVSVVNISSPFAVGLRLLPDGWLYSLGGQEFTEVRLIGGRRLLVGLGAASGLSEAVRRSLRP
ncbi:hypothetical protein [Deinococcus koreensis]|uniref:PH domain-containing protein n=1 Tax=Deinococcus koreensis TaxID=2054903 RepID=A0A2K3UU86_9DEIO|nr:hypothetical protein [Deinococcus koreensis]PNY80091.1 hypothetical protein CVO96_00845 [Deinococcus koreensis]